MRIVNRATLPRVSMPEKWENETSPQGARTPAGSDPLSVSRIRKGLPLMLEESLPTCSVIDCASRASRRGWCEKHYRRWRRNGGPEVSAQMGRPRQGEATYNAVHLRLKYDRGEAKSKPCADCGSPAQSWSYDRQDPEQLWDDLGRPYSLNQDHYEPRCWPCHNRMDRAARKREAA